MPNQKKPEVPHQSYVLFGGVLVVGRRECIINYNYIDNYIYIYINILTIIITFNLTIMNHHVLYII